MEKIVTAGWIALAGGLGSVCRWLVWQALARGPRWPVATLAVNVIGSALIGLVMALFAARGELDTRMRLALTAGFLGGFTTYSSFAYETLALLERRDPVAATLNLLLTLAAGLGACAGGLALGRWIGAR